MSLTEEEVRRLRRIEELARQLFIILREARELEKGYNQLIRVMILSTLAGMVIEEMGKLVGEGGPR